MKPYSITARLIATVLLIELISALGVAAVALVYEQHVHFRAFDVLLRGRADSMLGAVQDAEDANDNVMLDGTETAVPPDDIYQVADAGGRVLGRSANWVGNDLPGPRERIELERKTPGQEEEFYEISIRGEKYRVIRLQGLRIVDPGDKNGGIRRYVTVYYGSSMKRVWGAVLRTVNFYAISSLLVLACTGILMSWLLNRGLRPLRELAASASRVSVATWNFTPPEKARMTRELSPLVSALEVLLGSLQRSFEQQRRFVGDAAHELKTSVAVVKSSLQLLTMKTRTPQEYQAGLERCLADCQRMEGIVAQMLTLASVEESNTATAASPQTDLARCLPEVAQELVAISQLNQVSIRIQNPVSLMARVEPAQFHLLCSNLLLNALQHSPPMSQVSIEIKQDAAYAQLTIGDQGEGIAAESLPFIFERFSRAEPSRSRKTGGTGLGLAICKAVVDKCGGSIEMQSEPGRGTTVVVRLPIGKADSNPP